MKNVNLFIVTVALCFASASHADSTYVASSIFEAACPGTNVYNTNLVALSNGALQDAGVRTYLAPKNPTGNVLHSFRFLRANVDRKTGAVSYVFSASFYNSDHWSCSAELKFVSNGCANGAAGVLLHINASSRCSDPYER